MSQQFGPSPLRDAIVSAIEIEGRERFLDEMIRDSGFPPRWDVLCKVKYHPPADTVDWRIEPIRYSPSDLLIHGEE
jgi:hypothetical protein